MSHQAFSLFLALRLDLGCFLQSHGILLAQQRRSNTQTLLVSCIGLLAAAFGPSYTYVLLRLVYGQKWSSTEAPAALACYCGYITLLALNGCTEAYVNAVADARSEHHLWHVGAAKLHALLFAVGLRVAAANVVHCCSHSFFQRLWLYFACCADVLSTCSHTLAAMRVAPVQSVGIVFLPCVYTQLQHLCQRYVIVTPYKSIGTSRFSRNHTSSRLGLPFKVKRGLNMKASCIRRQLSKSIRWQTVFSAAQIILSFALVWRLGAIGESTLLP